MTSIDRIIELEELLLGWQLSGAPGADIWAGELRLIAPSFEAPYSRYADALALMREHGIAITVDTAAVRLMSDPGFDEIGGVERVRALADCVGKNVIRNSDVGVGLAIRAMREHRELRSGGKIVSASSFAGKAVPAREDLVEDLIPAKNVTMLGGDGGTGKSLLAMQLAASTALGTRWLGKTVFKAGPVLFVSAEDDVDELHRRVAAIAAAENVPIDHLANLHIWPLAGEDALLAVLPAAFAPIMPTPLFQALETKIASLRPALVVLDTLSDLFGGNENDRGQARQFIGLLRGLAMRYGTTILLLAHPSLSGMSARSGTSGSTAWNNSVRSRLYLERVKGQDNSEDDPDLRVLRSMKANYSRTGAEIRVRWQRGVFVLPGEGEPVQAMIAKEKADRVFLEMLATYNAEKRNVGPSRGHGFAPAIFADDNRARGVSSRALAEAMNRLFDQGKIIAEETGPPSRRVKRLVLKQS